MHHHRFIDVAFVVAVFLSVVVAVELTLTHMPQSSPLPPKGTRDSRVRKKNQTNKQTHTVCSRWAGLRSSRRRGTLVRTQNLLTINSFPSCC